MGKYEAFLWGHPEKIKGHLEGKNFSAKRDLSHKKSTSQGS